MTSFEDKERRRKKRQHKYQKARNRERDFTSRPIKDFVSKKNKKLNPREVPLYDREED